MREIAARALLQRERLDGAASRARRLGDRRSISLCMRLHQPVQPIERIGGRRRSSRRAKSRSRRSPARARWRARTSPAAASRRRRARRRPRRWSRPRPIAATTKRSTGFGCEKECDDVAERILAWRSAPSRSTPTRQRSTYCESKLRGVSRSVLVHPTRCRRVAVGRFVRNPDPHVRLPSLARGRLKRTDTAPKSCSASRALSSMNCGDELVQAALEDLGHARALQSWRRSRAPALRRAAAPVRPRASESSARSMLS